MNNRTPTIVHYINCVAVGKTAYKIDYTKGYINIHNCWPNKE